MHHDSELLRRYADQGSETAFEELVQRHLPAVYAVVLRRVGGDTHLAEEVAQAVFLDLARKAGPLSRRESILGWLFVAARFAAAKAVRADRRRRHLLDRAMKETAVSTPDQDWSELRPLLDQAVHELDAGEREAVLLYFYGQRTYRDVGLTLRLTENGARMRVERALEKLRRALGRRGVSSTAAAVAGALAGQAAAAVPAGLGSAVAATAVAAAAVASPTALGLLIMTITKTQLAATLAVVIAGAAFLGVAQQSRMSAMEKQLSSSAAAAAALERKVRSLQGLLSAQTSLVSKLRGDLAASAANGSRGPAQGSDPRVVSLHLTDVIHDHPEYRALMAKADRRRTVQMYAKAIAALNLPADQASRLKELLVERDQTEEDAMIAAAEQGLDTSSPEARKAVSDAMRESSQSIVQLAGAAWVDRLEALKEQSFSGNPANDALIDMGDAGIAPTPDQATALAQLIHDLADPAKNPAASQPGFQKPDPATFLSPYDQQVIAQAASLLSPSQVSILAAARSDHNHVNAILSEYSKGGNMMITL